MRGWTLRMDFELFTSPDIVRGAERIEIAAIADLYRSVPVPALRSCQAARFHVGGALGALAGGVDVLAFNRVLGLGLEEPATPAMLDEIKLRYQGAHVPRFFVQVGPLARPDGLISRLREAGFQRHNRWRKLCRAAGDPLAPVATDLRLARLDSAHEAAFGDVVVGGFGWPEQMRHWVGALIGRPGWLHYGAFLGERLVATSALYTEGDWGWLDFAATLPVARGCGAQSALIAWRVRDARRLGVRWLAVETSEPGSAGAPQSYQNMRRLGFEVAYARPNWIYHFTPPGD